MKKIFSVLVMAVAAMAMVSCGNGGVNTAIEKANEAKDVARLAAIGDSILALGDKADGTTQAMGVISYATAYGFMASAQNDPAVQATLKGYEDFKDLDKYQKYCENFVALYESSKAKDADASKKVYDELAKGMGGGTIDDVIAKVKESIALVEQVKAQQAAGAEQVEGEAAEGAEEAAEEVVEEEEVEE